VREYSVLVEGGEILMIISVLYNIAVCRIIYILKTLYKNLGF